MKIKTSARYNYGYWARTKIRRTVLYNFYHLMEAWQEINKKTTEFNYSIGQISINSGS